MRITLAGARTANNSRMRKILAAATAAAPAVLWAMTGGASFAATCTITATSAAFGNYVPGNGPAYATTTVKAACTSGAVFGLGLSAGLSGTQAQRLLMDGTYSVQYNVYISAAYGTIWGDGTGTSQIFTGTGTGTSTPVSFTAYGLLPDNSVNQAAVPGAYADNLLVVATF
jgi:spore coat protein U-like protein